ncbi:hypothetical protein N665_0218s0062 [Sinapis alba]|nr:hypothetical protein N665_0218s0062 [Sinapis alba]
MTEITKSSSSSVSGNLGGDKGKVRRGDKGRGIPKFCKCGEEVVIKTSGTAKNPGRLFYFCPNGYDGDKQHLFTWTDERLVEEIEDLQCEASNVKGEVSELKADMVGLEKLVEGTKLSLEW